MTATEETNVGLQPYSAYRDSGVPWLGEVPADWEVQPVRRCFDVVGGTTPESGRGDYWDGDVLWATPEDLSKVNGTRLADTRRKITRTALDETTLTVVPEDSILLTTRAPIGNLALTAAPMTFNQGCKALIPRAGFIPQFGYYVLLQAAPVLQAAGKGTTFMELAGGVLKSFPFPVPSPEEQQAIATFLDRETARIDELLREQEALLGELALRRDAVISEGATKGLGGAPLRESGVTWAGQVPAHWEFVKLRSVARLESGHTPSRSRPEYWENCTIPWVSLSDVRRFRDGRLKYIEDTEEKISELGMAHSAARLLPRGTVILSRTASVGFSAILGADMATTQDFANWVCGPRLLPEYLLYVLRGMKHEFARLMMGSTHQTIYMPDIRELQIPLPPLEEQQAIVQRLDTQLAQIDTLAAEVRASIALMRQHRSALITAAVTGKIDVRQA